ncbi:MAG: GAF domain-containing protein [Polyangiales bacterium]|nr:hypothetical protein [Myxococcales bacterium]MCB9657357.1 hypothetical protein [Sandaracinaceae bacterium]
MVEYAAFVREVEVWSPLGGGAYTCMMANRAGQTISEVGAPQGREGAAALVTRTVSHGRPGFATEGREHVRVALPLFTGEEVSSVVVLGCYSEAGRRGGVEVWEPSPEDDLVRVEGFYGGLSGFEMASRSTRFARGIGLPGITWDRQLPHIIDDVRFSPLFLRAAHAREHALVLGLGVPIGRAGHVEHVVLLLTALSTPPARALEVWVPDDQGRLWLDQAVHDVGLETLGRTSRTTCLMPGEGVAAQAALTGQPRVWTPSGEDCGVTDQDATRAGLAFGVAIPIMGEERARAVLLLRS